MRHPLFPLNTVLFPGNQLPLQIFEQRYLSLVTESLREQQGFVAVLISDGQEVDDTPKIFSTGCYVEITDWETLDNGLLGVTITGRYRTTLKDISIRDSGLMMAETINLDDTIISETHYPLPEPYWHLRETLKQLLQHPFTKYLREEIDYNCARQVCYHLCNLLPINNEQKQFLLEVPSIEELLDQVCLHIKALQK